MADPKISLAQLISEIINEVGDLKNIEPYKYTTSKWKYGFIGKFKAILPSSDEIPVEVYITKIDERNKLDIELPSVFEVEDQRVIGFAIAYTIKGIDAQYEKSDLKTYTKIMATVVSILKEIIAKNEAIYYKPLYLFSSTSKEGIMGSVDTKLKYYQAILNYNLSSGYRMGKGTFAGMDMIAIQKIKD
jgi:hypothetical protein